MVHNKSLYVTVLGSLTLMAAVLTAPTATHSQGTGPGNFVDSPNPDGVSRTLTTARAFDIRNPFFQALGTNGRTCATCHPPTQGMIITPTYAIQVFNATNGLDPLFAPVDGANAPNLDMSTPEARAANCSMLLTKGLFRIGIPMPPNAEFTLAAVDDPYGYSHAADLSCFRRPLPTTNLRFLASVMWDGRELLNQNSIMSALAQQARHAATGHLQASMPPSNAQIAQIVNFEITLYTSQIFDSAVGNLNTQQIGEGPQYMVGLPFSSGINDAFGLIRGRQPFDSEVFTFFDDWLVDSQRSGHLERSGRSGRSERAMPTLAQQAAARGERLFNTRQFTISGVAGLNDLPGKSGIRGTCSSCHSLPGVGSNALPLLLNTGIADGARRTPDMPLYTLQNKKTGKTVQTTDPGLAMSTGKWTDIGKFKVPSLRGLETQSPYMHNGFSAELLDTLDFYDARFSIGLSEQEKLDLRAFLMTL
ncbi:MAG: hypothetical protein JWN14_2038 [Chthonomonadales bacterium]|nr:hypothetical protein [Chthonomonadales bacterium]